MAEVTLNDGRVITIPDGLPKERRVYVIQKIMSGKGKDFPSFEEFSKTGGGAKAPRSPAELPQSKAPGMTWPQAGELALESLGDTASDIGYAATHGPETAAAMDAAFNASAKRFGEAPWETTKAAASGVIDSLNRGVTTVAGLVGSIPGAPLLEQLPGGDPAALQRHIEQAKLNIANQPVSTAFDVAGIVPGVGLPAAGAARTGAAGGRLLSGDVAAERLLNAGITPELRARQAQFGPEATSLDVQPPPQRERALSYVAKLPATEVDPLREALRRRGKLLGTRHRADVEEAANLPPGALLRPGEHLQGVAGRSRAIQEQYTEQATRQRDVATQARNRAAAERTEAARTERNELYPRAFEQHADMPLDNYADILETPAAKKILDDFAAEEPTLAAARGHGIGNLEKLDKLELQLSRDMENFSPGTIAWNTRRELAQAIRDRLSKQFEGVPEMEDYRNARLLHARVANAPEPSAPTTSRVRMPQSARDALDRLVQNARSTEQFAKEGVATKFRDKMVGDIQAAVPAHLQADIIQGGTNRERAFDELRRMLPKGVEPGAWQAFRRAIISYIGYGGAGGAAALHALGMPSEVGTAVGGASLLLGTGAAIRRGHQKRIGRRILERTMEELPEPEAYVPGRSTTTLLGRRQGTP